MTRTDDREALLRLMAWADDNAYRGDTAAIQHRWMTVAALAREKLDALDAPVFDVAFESNIALALDARGFEHRDIREVLDVIRREIGLARPARRGHDHE